MAQDETKKPVRVTRQDLYRQVWETPMIRLGLQYGISGNGLKKICNRLRVPYPPAGYWAKLRFGKRVRAIPLPEAGEETPKEVIIRPTPPSVETKLPALMRELAEKLQKAAASTSAISIPESVRRPHPSIAAWIAEHQRRMEQNRWRRFTELAKTWERASLASRFIEALEKLPTDTEYSYGGRTSSEWLAWARERRDEFDPTRWAVGEVCLKLAEVTSWQYPD